MVLNIQELKQITDKILSAVDSSDVSNITETLELEVKNDNLYDDIVTKYGYNKSLISASITGRKEIVYGMYWVRVNMVEIGKFKLEDLIKESI